MNDRPTCIALTSVLAVYLLIRHTAFLQLFNLGIVDRVTGIPESTWVSITLIVLFLVLAAIIAISKRADRLIRHLLVQKRGLHAVILLLLTASTLLLVLGKLTYTEYTDEIRDVRVSNLVAEHGMGIFVDNYGLETVADSTIHHAHEWAQRIHPPGQYVPAAVLPVAERNLLFYRLLFLLPVVGVALALVARFNLDSRHHLLLIVCGTLLLSLTFFRNYTLIRFGNELIPFIGFSLLLGLVHSAYQSPKPAWGSFLILGSIAFAMAVFTKFSALVAIIALVAALTLSWVIQRERRLVVLAAAVALIFVASAFGYFAIFDGTVLLERHIQSYGGRILESLRLVSRDELIAQGITPEGRSSISWFFLSIPSGYGPLIVLSTLWSLVRIVRKGPDTIDIVLLLFLSIGLVGVLMVNPRPQYTAPLLFGLVFFSARHIIDALDNEQIVRLSFIAYIFVGVEILLFSLS